MKKETLKKLNFLKLKLISISILLTCIFIAWKTIQLNNPNLKFQFVNNELACKPEISHFYQPGKIIKFELNFQNTAQSDWSQLLAENSERKNNEQSTVQNNIPQLNKGLSQTSFLSIQSQWEMSVQEKEGHLEIVNHLIDPKIVFKHNEIADPQLTDEIKLQLQKPFVISLNKQGLITDFRYDKNLSNVEKNILRMLTSDTQIVFADNINQNDKSSLSSNTNSSWITNEKDFNGTYEAKYKIGPNPNNSMQILLNKSKVRYIDTSSLVKKKTHQFQPIVFTLNFVPQSETTIALDCDQHVLNNLQMNSVIQTKVNRAEIAVSRTQLSLKFITSFLQNQVLSLNNNNNNNNISNLASNQNTGLSAFQLEKGTLNSSDSAEVMERLIQQNELGHLHAPQLFKLLAEAKKLPNDSSAIQDLYLKFKALIYLEPDSCKEIAKLLLNENPQESKTMMMLATALATVESNSAQQALIEVLKARIDDIPAVQILIPSLGMMEHPSIQAEDLLRNIILSSYNEDVITAAGLSLGAMAGHLADQAPERQRSIVESVHKDFENANTEAQKKYLIAILGNAGSLESLPLLTNTLINGTVSLQTESAMALRFIPGQDVETQLQGLLSVQKDERVRMAAAEALGYREPSENLSQNLQKSFARENSVPVRIILLKDIFENRSVDPHVAEWIKNIANTDPSPEIKKAAGQMLENLLAIR